MSENVKHTPGPWIAVEEEDRTIIGCGWDFLGRHIAYMSDGGVPRDEEWANTHLIAAAPDLLEALKGLLSDIEEYQRINKLGGENNHWQVISRAAIAKAEARP